MLKNITLGQYFPGDSVVHRLDPRTKIWMTIGLILAVFCVSSFTGYAIVLDWAYMRLDTMDETVKQENETIHQIITLLDEKGEEWTDVLPIVWQDGEYVFLPDMDKEIETLKGRDYADVNSYASAQLCMESLIEKYDVEGYTPEMMATLLLPAGVTSTASIQFKDEADLLNGADDVDKVYVEEILPLKMEYNLQDVKKFSLPRDLRIMLTTVGAVTNRGE